MGINLLTSLTHSGVVWSVSWSCDGLLLASCGGNKEIKVWKNNTKDEWSIQDIIKAHTRSIRRVTWHPVITSLMSSCGFDGSTIIWNKTFTGFSESNSLEGHESEVKDSCWDSSGKFISICGRDKTIWIWEMDSDFEFNCVGVISSHSADVKSLRWHPRLPILASCSYDNDIMLHHQVGDEWETYQTLSQHKSTVWSLAFNGDGSKFVSCGADGCVEMWNLRIGGDKPVYEYFGSLGETSRLPVYSVDWCHGSGLIAWAGSERNIYVCGSDGGNFEVVSDAHDCEINCISWNSANGLLASCGDDGLVKIWRITGF